MRHLRFLGLFLLIFATTTSYGYLAVKVVNNADEACVLREVILNSGSKYVPDTFEIIQPGDTQEARLYNGIILADADFEFSCGDDNFKFHCEANDRFWSLAPFVTVLSSDDGVSLECSSTVGWRFDVTGMLETGAVVITVTHNHVSESAP